MPSTGIRSPGRTRSTSPGMTSSSGTSTNPPSRSTRAYLGCRPMSRLIASLFLPFAFASRKRPSRISVMITADAS